MQCHQKRFRNHQIFVPAKQIYMQIYNKIKKIKNYEKK